LYGNVRVEAGLSQLHLLVSLGKDNTRYVWQFGLGSIVHKGKSKQWQVFATWSPLQTRFPSDTLAIGNGKTYTAKGFWVSTGLHYCGRISSHWAFRIGISANLLKTAYYLDGQLTSEVNTSPWVKDPDKTYSLLKPPYYMINTFKKDKPTNYKGWVGMSAGIYYNFLN